MPFVPKTPNRKAIDKDGIKACKSVGDLCYYYYRRIMNAWNINKRWTTAHNIYKEVRRNKNMFTQKQEEFWLRSDFEQEDIKAAEDLAWQVFFQLHVMPYEHKKRDENGDII